VLGPSVQTRVVPSPRRHKPLVAVSQRTTYAQCLRSPRSRTAYTTDLPVTPSAEIVLGFATVLPGVSTAAAVPQPSRMAVRQTASAKRLTDA
jgi:hypothetical protein